jgi:NitT/TauT family transport system ATP-binding protein
MERLAANPFDGHADLPLLAEVSELSDEVFLDLMDALVMFGFALVKGGDVDLTPLGEQFAGGDGGLRRRIVGQQAMARVPLVAHIRHSLEQSDGKPMAYETIEALLGFALDTAAVESTMRHAIEWARFGELIDIDFSKRLVFLPPQAV